MADGHTGCRAAGRRAEFSRQTPGSVSLAGASTHLGGQWASPENAAVSCSLTLPLPLILRWWVMLRWRWPGSPGAAGPLALTPSRPAQTPPRPPQLVRGRSGAGMLHWKGALETPYRHQRRGQARAGEPGDSGAVGWLAGRLGQPHGGNQAGRRAAGSSRLQQQRRQQSSSSSSSERTAAAAAAGPNPNPITRVSLCNLDWLEPGAGLVVKQQLCGTFRVAACCICGSVCFGFREAPAQQRLQAGGALQSRRGRDGCACSCSRLVTSGESAHRRTHNHTPTSIKQTQRTHNSRCLEAPCGI